MPFANKRESDISFLARVQAAGSAGVNSADFKDMTSREIEGAKSRLTKAGKLFRSNVGHRTMRMFAEIAWANAHAVGATTASAARSGGKRCRADWPDDAEIFYPKDAHGNPLYKYSYTPAPQLPPEAPIRTTFYVPY